MKAPFNMGSTKEEQDRVRSLLLDTVTLLCKNGLNFKKQLKVQGLLGITLDEDDVFIVHINEKVGELIVEHQKKDDSDESSIDSTPAKVHRKRRSDSSPMYKGPPDKIRIKTEKEDPDGADLILIDENECDDKSKIQKTIVQHQQQQPGLHSITNFQTGYQHFNQQNNMQTGPGYMTSTNVVPHQNMPQTGQPTPEKVYYYSNRRRRCSGAMGAKRFFCEVEGCDRGYYEKRHLLEHQFLKHGRARPSRKCPGSFSINLGQGEMMAVPQPNANVGEMISMPQSNANLSETITGTCEAVVKWEDPNKKTQSDIINVPFLKPCEQSSDKINTPDDSEEDCKDGPVMKKLYSVDDSEVLPITPQDNHKNLYENYEIQPAILNKLTSTIESNTDVDDETIELAIGDFGENENVSHKMENTQL